MPNQNNSRCAVIFVLITALFIAACAVTPALDASGVNSRATPFDVSQDIDLARGKTVQWGGRILKVRNDAQQTRLEVLSFPLRRNGVPNESRRSTGRFLLLRAGFLEPIDYAPGRYVTVVGEIVGLERGRVGTAEYPLPVVRSRQTKLWPRNSRTWGFLPFISIGVGFDL